MSIDVLFPLFSLAFPLERQSQAADGRWCRHYFTLGDMLGRNCSNANRYQASFRAHVCPSLYVGSAIPTHSDNYRECVRVRMKLKEGGGALVAISN